MLGRRASVSERARKMAVVKKTGPCDEVWLAYTLEGQATSEQSETHANDHKVPGRRDWVSCEGQEDG